MGFFDNLFGARTASTTQPTTAPQLLATHDGPPHGNRMRQFTIHDAMNGQYIEYMRRKYNPNGPDDWAKEIYIVQPGESLIDAIGAVLVILEK
jgi:hypothetical protein